MKDYSGIHISASDFNLPPLFINFFRKRLEKLRSHSFFDSTIFLRFSKTENSYHGELKLNDLDISLGCYDQSEDILELFKELEKEMMEKMNIWQLKEDYQHIYF